MSRWVGISQGYLSLIESGNKWPSTKLFRRIVRAIGLPDDLQEEYRDCESDTLIGSEFMAALTLLIEVISRAGARIKCFDCGHLLETWEVVSGPLPEVGLEDETFLYWFCGNCHSKWGMEIDEETLALGDLRRLPTMR